MKNDSNGTLRLSEAQEDSTTRCCYLETELQRCSQELSTISARLEEHTTTCMAAELFYSPVVHRNLSEHIEQIKLAIDAELKQKDGSESTESFLRRESLVRWSLHSLAYFKSALEWKAPAYAQSHLTQFFDPRALGSSGVNYDRYESPEILELENRLAHVLGIDRDKQALLLTSSGMGAYTLIESYLLRCVFGQSRRVVLAPYIYFECTEQLLSIPGLEVENAPSYDAQEIAATAVQSRAAVVFADPIANDLQQRKVDLPTLISELRSASDLGSSLDPAFNLVIDGTMTSGCLDPQLLRSDAALRIFYYEGCNKYIQHGLDLHMAGLVVVPKDLKDIFYKLRRNTGTNLPRPAAQSFPAITRDQHLQRMAAIEKTASQVTEELQANLSTLPCIQVICSAHKSHLDHHMRDHLAFHGGCVTFRITDQQKGSREGLNKLISNVLSLGHEHGLFISKGVSFGFAFPRISAAASMAGTIDPFLRLYVGHPPAEQVAKLIEVLTICIRDYLGKA